MAKSLDALIDFLLDEIALSGDRGLRFLDVVKSTRKFYLPSKTLTPSSIGTSTADSSQPQSPGQPLLDLAFFEKVLKWLARHPDVSIGVDHQYDQVTLSQLETKFPGYNALEELHLTSTNAGISTLPVGANQQTLTDLNNVTRPDSASTSQDQRRHGPRIYVSEERMFLAICEHLPDPTRVFPSEWTLLTCIAQTRDEGILQGELGRLTGQDKRSVPARTDKLHTKGYIVKKTVYVKGNRTSRIYLKRFSPDRALNLGQPSTHTVKHHASRLFVVLKSSPLIPQDDLSDALELKTQDQLKVFSQIIRHFSRFGCIKRTRTAFGPSPQAGDLKMCIQYLREPSAEDWTDASGNIDFDELVDGPPRLMAQPNPVVPVATNFSQNAPASGPSRLPKMADLQQSRPQWNPDRVLANVLFDATQMSGTEGMTNLGARIFITGVFVRRVLESFMIKISHQSLQAQPPGLRHLCIVRSKKATDSNTQYVHHTYGTYNLKVKSGKASWQDIDSNGRFAKQILERTEDGSHTEVYPRDAFNFPIPAQHDGVSHSAPASRSELVKSALISDVRLMAGEPVLHEIVPREANVSSAREDILDTENPTFLARGRKSNTKTGRKTGSEKTRASSNTSPSKISKEASAGKTVLGRPRKFVRGTEKFWRDMFAAIIRENNPKHSRTSSIAGLTKDPAGLKIFQSRPPDFDETLVAAIEAGLPIPRGPSCITVEWVTSTQDALKLPNVGLYFTQTGHKPRSRSTLSKIMIIKNPRLRELNLIDKPKIWPWQHLSSSASHSHVFRGHHPQAGMNSSEVEDSWCVSRELSQGQNSIRHQERNYPSQGSFPEDAPSSEPTPLITSLFPVDGFPTTPSQVDDIPAATETNVESPAQLTRSMTALPAADFKYTSTTTTQSPLSRRGDRDGFGVSTSTRLDRSNKPAQKSVESLTSQQHTDTYVLATTIHESQSAVAIGVVRDTNNIALYEVTDVVQNAASVSPPSIAVEAKNQDAEDLQSQPQNFVASEELFERDSKVDNLLSSFPTEEQVVVENSPTSTPQIDLDVHNIDPRILGAGAGIVFGITTIDDAARSEVMTNDSPDLGPGVQLSSHPSSLQSARKRKAPDRESFPGTIETVRPAKYAKIITSTSEAGKLCRRIIVDLINLCSGLAPSDAWTFRRAMTTRWHESGIDVEQPTAKLVRSHLKQLGTGSRLKQITFAFRGKSGSMVSKSIIALRTISNLSPELLDLQRKMKEAEPEDYVPPELLAEFYRTPIEQPRWELSRLEDGNNDPDIDSVRDSNKSLASDLRSPSPKPPSATTGFLTLKVPNLRALDFLPQHRIPQSQPSIPILQPKRRGKQTHKQREEDTARGHITWANQQRTLPNSLNDVPDMRLRREEAALAHGQDQYACFKAEVDCVAEWEARSLFLFDKPLSRPVFFNHGIDVEKAPHVHKPFRVLSFKSIVSFDSEGREHETGFPEEHSWPPFAGTITHRSSAQLPSQPALEEVTSTARRSPAKRKRGDSVQEITPRKRRRRPLLAPGLGSGGSTRVTVEDTASRVKDRKHRRQGQKIKYMSEDTQYQVVITCIIVRTLAGGIDKFIDWALVQRLISEHDEEFLQSAWKGLLGRYRSDIAGLTECLQDRYLDALVSGEVPTVNFDDLHATDWEGIRRWSLANLEKFTIKKVDDLPATKSEFLRHNDLVVGESTGVRDMLGFCVLTTQPKKEEIMGGLIFGTTVEQPLPKEVSEPGVDSMVGLAKSWIVSILMTPEESYDPLKAHRKLLKLSANPTDSEAILEQALKSLQQDKAVSRFRATARTAPSLANKDAVVGVRSWQISTKYYESIDTRRQITGSLLRKARKYKLEVLDEAFARGCSVVIPKDSVVDDSAMIAILNLMDSGATRVRAGHDKPDTRYGLDHESVAYTTKHINKQALAFSIILEQTPHIYIQGDPLKDRRRTVSIPRGEIDDPSERGRIPPWFDINLTFLPKIWEIFLGAVVGLISIRPGMDLTELTKNFNGVAGEWEVGLVVDYLDKLSVIRRSRLGDGWETEVWWWMSIESGSEGEARHEVSNTGAGEGAEEIN